MQQNRQVDFFQIIRRSSPEEKVLVVSKFRAAHRCSKLWLVIAIVVWDAVDVVKADSLYNKLKVVLPEYGISTEVKPHLLRSWALYLGATKKVQR